MNLTANRVVLSALLLTVVGPSYAQVPLAEPPRPAGPFEYEDIGAAWQAAQQSRQPLLVFVTSSHCHFCVRMVNETLTHPQLAPAFSNFFETVVVHAERNPALTEKLGVRMFPTTLVVSPEGTLLGKLNGFVAPNEIGSQLNPMLKSYYDSIERDRSQIASASAAQATVAPSRRAAAASSAK